MHPGGGCDERGGPVRYRLAENPSDEAAMRVPLRIAASLSGRLRGMLFSPEQPGALLLAPCRDVHTIGMRHDLDIAFIDADGVVVEAYREVGPMRRVRCRGAAATIERFSESGPWFKAGDRVGISILPDRYRVVEKEGFKR